MSDTANKEEEYKFPGDDDYSNMEESSHAEEQSYDVDTGSYASSGGEGMDAVTLKEENQSRGLNKRIVAVLALAIIATIAVSFLRRGETKPSPAVVQKKPVVVAQKAAPRVIYKPSNDSIALAGKVQDNASAISLLGGRVDGISTDVSSISANQAKMVPLITDMHTQLKKMVDAKNKKLAAQKKKKLMKAETYYIRAMVPGRAWLVSTFGKTASVSKNETLRGYGKILKVDDNDGIVYTSSGRKILYGKNDE